MQVRSARRRPGEGIVPRPGAILVTGSPGSGKTTLATVLATALHYAIVDLDTVTGALTRAALRSSVGDETAIDSPAGVALRAARYESLLDVAAANLAVGVGVVIAAPFTAERESAEGFQAVLQRLRSDVALFYIDAPDEVVRARLQSRDAPRDRAKRSRPLAPGRPGKLVPWAIVIDGTARVEEQLAQALGALGRPEDLRPPDSKASSC